MKLNRTIIACAALAFASTFSLVRAEMPSAEVSTESTPTPTQKAGTRLDRLTEKLHLTDGQRLQVGAILKTQRAAEAALKADTTTTADVKKAKRREIRAAHNSQIRAILTSEQQPVFDESTKIGFAKKKS